MWSRTGGRRSRLIRNIWYSFCKFLGKLFKSFFFFSVKSSASSSVNKVEYSDVFLASAFSEWRCKKTEEVYRICTLRSQQNVSSRTLIIFVQPVCLNNLLLQNKIYPKYNVSTSSFFFFFLSTTLFHGSIGYCIQLRSVM